MSELKKLAKQADLAIKDLVNTKSQAYKQIKPDLSTMGEKEILDLISSNPRILIRPILSDGKKMIMGFKEEQYREYIK